MVSISGMGFMLDEGGQIIIGHFVDRHRTPEPPCFGHSGKRIRHRVHEFFRFPFGIEGISLKADCPVAHCLSPVWGLGGKRVMVNSPP